MNAERMNEVFSDEAFVKSLFELETATEVQAALKEKGIELTEEEALPFRDAFLKAESGEFSEDMLEQITGGILLQEWADPSKPTCGRLA